MQVVKCRQCGEKLYGQTKVLETPWSGKATERTLHDINGNHLLACPGCGYDLTWPPPVLEDAERKKAKELLKEIYSNVNFSSKEARNSFYPKQPFKKLIQHHLDRLNREKIAGLIRDVMLSLDEKERKACEILVDVCNLRIDQHEFWDADCNDIFNLIWDEAVDILEDLQIDYDDYLVYSLFQFVVLSFTYNIQEKSELRKFIFSGGLKKAHFWLYFIVIGSVFIYHLLIGEFSWATFLIAGSLALILRGYFWVATGFK